MILEKILGIFHTNPDNGNECNINYKRQRLDNDCSQTCLDMLGYDGHGMFPPEKFSGGLMGRDWGSIPGIKIIDGGCPFNKPFRGVDSYVIVAIRTIPGGYQHAVVIYRNKVYCPSLGVFTIKKYAKRVGAMMVTAVYEVPIIASQTLQ